MCSNLLRGVLLLPIFWEKIVIKYLLACWKCLLLLLILLIFGGGMVHDILLTQDVSLVSLHTLIMYSVRQKSFCRHRDLRQKLLIIVSFICPMANFRELPQRN